MAFAPVTDGKYLGRLNKTLIGYLKVTPKIKASPLSVSEAFF